MLRSLYVTLDYHIIAADGEIGRVHDYLFDDESWIIHYVVVETGLGSDSRKVLIIPFVVGFMEWEAKRLSVRLTGDEIRKSPPITFDLPVSLQRAAGITRPGSHLRSMREMLGYKIHATDGEAGTFEDFIIEDTLWGVHHVVLALARSPQRSVLISPESIRSISWRGKAAWVNLSREEVERSAAFDPAAAVNHAAEHQLFDYYGRPVQPPLPASGGELGIRQH